MHILNNVFQTGGRKYFRRADLVAKETEEYLQKYGQQIKNEDENPSQTTVGLYFFTACFSSKLKYLQ